MRDACRSYVLTCLLLFMSMIKCRYKNSIWKALKFFLSQIFTDNSYVCFYSPMTFWHEFWFDLGQLKLCWFIYKLKGFENKVLVVLFKLTFVSIVVMERIHHYDLVAKIVTSHRLDGSLSPHYFRSIEKFVHWAIWWTLNFLASPWSALVRWGSVIPVAQLSFL